MFRLLIPGRLLLGDGWMCLFIYLAPSEHCAGTQGLSLTLPPPHSQPQLQGKLKHF